MYAKALEDKVSGTRADRPGLAKTLEVLREGDTLVVWKLDRLGRSVKQLVDLVGELHKQGVQFRSLSLIARLACFIFRFLRRPLILRPACRIVKDNRANGPGFRRKPTCRCRRLAGMLQESRGFLQRQRGQNT